MGNGANKEKKEKSEEKDKQRNCLLQTCEDHEGSINCMELSEDGSVLVTGSDDAMIRLWSTKTEMLECIGVMEGHEDYITSLLVEGNFVLSSSADKTIRKWDMLSCECMLVFMGHESTVNKMVCTGDFLFSCSYDKKARCWDFDTGEPIRVFTGHKNNITSLLFIPADKENLNDAMKFIQEHAAKKNLALNGNRLPPLGGKSQTMSMKQPLEDDDDEIYSKDLIITGSLDSFAKSWSIETGEVVQTFRGHTAAVTCLATDPFGKLLFSGSADYSIRSWEIMTGQLLKVFNGHQTTVISLLAHRKLLYSTSSDHTARCWVMEFGDCTRIYKEHTHSVSTCIESEGLLFTGCGDGAVRCFDAKSGALKRTFKGHTGAVNCIRVVDDMVLSGSFDGTLKVWDKSDLFAEKAGGINANQKDNQKEKTKAPKISIENEKSFSKSNLDNRPEVDSGFDDKEYGMPKAQRVKVRENV